ncbi:MAG: nitrogenase-stabilizing/protective protein NifW [Gammaproteobacteria bacterium]|nr:nitrogenase-stabilizing/protective protein NifW [Gammaproteobacteria bacterium]MCP5196951.1 nitrogenase-stabilizing/protective protein NifW [Gammaproteobacteria bacterium]
MTLRDELAELSSAEDFLNYFKINFEPAVVEVNRLHILKRFHDYLGQNDPAEWEGFAQCLQRAYQDFVESDALTEKVFKVFHRQAAQREVRIALADIGRPA